MSSDNLTDTPTIMEDVDFADVKDVDELPSHNTIEKRSRSSNQPTATTSSALDAESRARHIPASGTVFKIVSATYAPTEGRRLLTGQMTNDRSACIPFTRDVAPFLKALLVARKADDEQPSTVGTNSDTEDLVRFSGHERNAILLMDGKQMNTIFGDPCPGISKRLNIHYVTYEVGSSASSALEVHRVSFTEHDRVVLRHRITHYQDDAPLRNAVVAAATNTTRGYKDDTLLRSAVRMGRAQSIAEFEESISRNSEPRKWRLRSATSEVALPILLPFLEVTERVQCKLVCKVWRNVIRYWGIAETIDVDDDTLFPHFSRPILRGLLANSHHSLQSLFLSDYSDLMKEDLHPAIPHLRKLRCLDISRCNNLDDETLLLISEHLSSSLVVIYLKGLQKVTDNGLRSIAQSCSQLQVLEISNLRITDDSATVIGEHLIKLKALYMRDNYLVTNGSVDVITEKCTSLTQLTLWGCTRLRHLSFESPDLNLGCGQLVLLNLWGCHSLTDHASIALGTMKNLRSLIVSECHKLTNIFLLGLAQTVPQLNHLHLRYCKKITDIGVNAITSSMRNLYSLDLSFCSRVSSAALIDLLEIRRDTLVELRLQNCTHLDITRDLRHHNEFTGNFSGDGQAGRKILNSLRSSGNPCALSILDLRHCGGHNESMIGYPSDDAFVQGMTSLRFRQTIPGFFQRPTLPEAHIKNIMNNLLN